MVVTKKKMWCDRGGEKKVGHLGNYVVRDETGRCARNLSGTVTVTCS